MFALILLLCIGAVCAHENDTFNVNEELSAGDNLESDNIKEIIDNCKDSAVINLENKTYYLDDSNETHIVLNKSITVQGITDKTVIDGKNTSLFLDVDEIDVKVEEGVPLVISFWSDGYDFKYLGKNVTFKNITFKDLKMTTWHEMTFENCKFINSTFTSYEYSNTFKNCSFDKSIIEIVLFYGYGDTMYRDYSKIINCSLTDSLITFKSIYTKNYIHYVGGDQFQITNKLDIIDSKLCNSNISLYRNNITIKDSSFNNSNIRGGSNCINIADTEFRNPQIEVSHSTISIYNSTVENPIFRLHGGYFSKGPELTLDNTTVNNCELETTATIGSRIGNVKIRNSQVNNSTFNLTYVNLLTNNSEFNNSSFEMFFSNADIMNSTFVNDGSILDTIKTRNYKEVYTSKDNEIFTPSLKECQVKTDYKVKNSYLINASGKFEIKAEDINMDTTHRITVFPEGSVFYFNDKIIIKAEDYMGNPVSGLEIFIEDWDDYTYPTPSVITDSNGTAEYRINKLGNVSLEIYYETDGLVNVHSRYGIDLNLTIMPTVSNIKVSKVKFNANVFSNIKGYLKIQTVANTSANLNNLKFSYKVYTNGKAKTYYSKSDAKGVTTFKLPETLTAGNHKIEIRLVNTNIKKTLTVKIAKAKTTVKAPKVTNKYKKSKYFKVTVKNKATKKAVSNVKVKIKVFTGKKYKTYIVKTNKKGMTQINTKNLKVGKHIVKITSANVNYHISAKSQITIR